MGKRTSGGLLCQILPPCQAPNPDTGLLQSASVIQFVQTREAPLRRLGLYSG